jgi:CHRD domain
MFKTIAAAVGAGLVLVGLASAAPAEDTYKLTANLKVRFEVPKPQGVPAGATGLFTGTAVELANERARLTWRLTFAKMTGKAVAAHIHAGRVGKAGRVMVPLCGPCRSGQRGTAGITQAVLQSMRAGRTYVNVHTAKNAAGEIRGQLKTSKTSSSGDEGPPPTTPDPTPPPPYPEIRRSRRPRSPGARGRAGSGARGAPPSACRRLRSRGSRASSAPPAPSRRRARRA